MPKNVSWLGEPKSRIALFTVATLATLVIGIDQTTKSWALGELDEKIIHVIGPLQLALTRNSGVAFGLGGGAAPFLVLAALFILIVVFRGLRSELTTLAQVGFGLMLGGAFSNLVDRLFRDRGGSVVDFLDLQFWPVFNIADLAIVLGAACLVIWSMRHPTESKSQ